MTIAFSSGQCKVEGSGRRWQVDFPKGRPDIHESLLKLRQAGAHNKDIMVRPSLKSLVLFL